MPAAEDFIRPCGLCNMLGHDCQACAARKDQVKPLLDGFRDLVQEKKPYTYDDYWNQKR